MNSNSEKFGAWPLRPIMDEEDAARADMEKALGRAVAGMAEATRERDEARAELARALATCTRSSERIGELARERQDAAGEQTRQLKEASILMEQATEALAIVTDERDKAWQALKARALTRVKEHAAFEALQDELAKAKGDAQVLRSERDEARRVAAQLAEALQTCLRHHQRDSNWQERSAMTWQVHNERLCDALALMPEGWSEAGLKEKGTK